KTPDSSGNARDLNIPTNSSAPTFGINGQHTTNAFSFDGINDFLYGQSSLTSNVDDIKAGPDTTSGWFKYTGANNNNKKIIYREGSSPGGDYYQIALGNGTTTGHGKLFFTFQTTSTPSTNPPQGNCFTTSSNLENGNWQHFVAVRDGDFTCRIYINGTLDGIPDTIGCPVCTGLGTNTVDVSGPAEIARSPVPGLSNYFQGNIDEVFHWNNYSLTSTQAMALYNANYGTKAHTIIFKIDKTDSMGTTKANIKTDTRYFPFFDTRATNSFNKIINYTTNVSSNQIFGSGDRLKFTIIWQSGLNMTLRLDDNTLSNPITSFLQTPALTPGFPIYNNGGTNGTDITPPVVTGNLSKLPNSNNWYNTPVTVTWIGIDASGIASCDNPTTYSGPSGTSIFIIGHCTDNAGNIGTGSVAIDYDSISPALGLPSALEVKTHNPSGAIVLYNVTATDNIYSPISTSSKKYSTAILFGSIIPSNDTVKMLLKYYNSTDYIPDYKNAPRFSLFANQTRVLVSPSLADMQSEINLAKNFTLKPNILAYDIENWQYTPQQEQDNPVQSINQAADITHSSGYQFGTTPG
ncbi:MAG TPA: LamG-like jellyroll fold domain-containing protein, partial [Nitrosopumilaceae archaeon]|nr:LamG-like jellyroll fold domain-containing protein [Nitrosopumilaceae archaeon]